MRARKKNVDVASMAPCLAYAAFSGVKQKWLLKIISNPIDCSQ